MKDNEKMYRRFQFKDTELDDLKTKRFAKNQRKRSEEMSHLSDPGVARLLEGRDDTSASGSWWEHPLVPQESLTSNNGEGKDDKLETVEAPVPKIKQRGSMPLSPTSMALSPTSTFSSVTEFSSFTRHSEEREQPDQAPTTEQKISNTMILDKLIEEDPSVLYEGSVASSSTKYSKSKITDQLLRIAEEDSVVFEGSVSSSKHSSKHSKKILELLRIAEEDSLIFEGSIASQSAYSSLPPRSPKKSRSPKKRGSPRKYSRNVTKEMHESVNLLEDILKSDEEGITYTKMEHPHSQKDGESEQSAIQEPSDDKHNDFSNENLNSDFAKENLNVRQGNDETSIGSIEDDFTFIHKGQRRWLYIAAVLVFFISVAAVLLLLVLVSDSSTERVSERERVEALRKAAESMSGIEILSDTRSPQWKALEWITENDDAQKVLHDLSYADLVQRYVVAVLYFSTTGKAWSEQYNFLKKSSFCEWTEVTETYEEQVNGIECDDGFNIKKIILQDNNLEGTIPKELAYLTSLQVLKLSGNMIEGKFPSELGFLTNLVEIDLLRNYLEGEIPSEIGGMIKLENLDLSSNALTGTLPTEIGKLALLERLSVGDNQLTGTIPSTMALLKSLSTLNVFHNNLEGTVPEALGNLPLLKAANFAANKFTGNLNPGFCSLVVHQYDALWADCRGSQPQVECECCTICCKEDNGDLEC